MPPGTLPFGWSLRAEAGAIARAQQRRRRLADTRFRFHQDPERAARATVSLRNAYPWMSPNLAAQLGAFGADVDSPAIAEIAGISAGRQARRGWADRGGQRRANEVRNAMPSPTPWRSRDVYDQRAAHDQSWQSHLPQAQITSTTAPGPVTPEDLGIATGATPREYARNVMGPMTAAQRREIARMGTDELEAAYPELAAEFGRKATEFAMARNEAEGRGGANMAFSLRTPTADPAAGAALARNLPSLDRTARHIRQGGLTFQGVPLPGGDVTAADLEAVYQGPDAGGIYEMFREKRGQLEDQYEGLAGTQYPFLPEGMTPSMRAVYDGLVTALDDYLEPERQSLGYDIGPFNISDVWNVPYDAARGTVRTATVVMDSLWQSGQGRFRQIVDDPTDAGNWAALNPVFALPAATTAAVTGGDFDPLHMGEQYGQTDLGIVLERLARGDRVDTGAGFFVEPGSEVQQTRLARERQYGDIGGHVITMGRFAADRAGLEPDSAPFDILSGAVDLAWMLVEPGGAAVDLLTRSKGFRAALARAGGHEATRAVDPALNDEWFRGEEAARVYQHYADIDSPESALRSWQEMSRAGGANRMPLWAHFALADGPVGNTAYVEEMMRAFTGQGYRTPGIARARAGRQSERLAEHGPIAQLAPHVPSPGVAWRRRINQSRLAQFAPETGARAVNTHNIDETLAQAESTLRNARVDDGTIARILHRISTEGYQLPYRTRVVQLEREIAALEFAGDRVFWRGEMVPTDFLRAQLEGTLEALGPGMFINKPTPRSNILHEIWFDEVQPAKRDRLIAAGVSPDVAEDTVRLQEVGRAVDSQVARDHELESVYWLRKTTEGTAVNRRVLAAVDGENVTDLTERGMAHMLAEHQGAYLPLEDDYRKIARLTRNQLQQWANFILASPTTGQARAFTTVIDGFMDKVWKPSRLIRPAWPLRVVGEEQFRSAAAGFDTAMGHPLSYVGLVLGFRREGRVHRALEAVGLGETGTMKLTPWETLAEHNAVLNRGQRTWIIPTGEATGGRFDPFRYYNKGEGRFDSGYFNAWADLMARAHSDDLMRRVAQIQLGIDSQFQSIDELIDAGGGAVQHADEIFTSGPVMRPTGKLALTDDGVLRHPAHASIRQARRDLMDAHPGSRLGQRGDRTYATRYANGGHEEIDNWDDYIESLQVRLDELTGGNDELVHVVARGMFEDGRLSLDKPGTNRLRRAAVNRLERDYAEFAPPVIGGDKAHYNSRLGQGDQALYDRAMERMFSLLGATPTDRLSRSPVFRQFYWRRMQELLPAMDGTAQRTALRVADSANLAERGWHLRMTAFVDDTTSSPTKASLNRAVGTGQGDLDWEMADELARRAALDNTRWLLYDVHKRGLFMDAMRVIFPFGEAWKEVATRWMQLWSQRPGTVTQRATQVLGATGTPQEWSEVVNDPSQHGWIFENSTGETVFGYPASEWFTSNVAGVPMELTGSLNGLTLFNSVVPGVGPMVQVPVGLVPALRDSPELDGVREVLFPFGFPDNPLTSPGATTNFVADQIFSPTVQRFFQGVAAGGLDELGVPDSSVDLGHIPGWDVVKAMSAIPGGGAPEWDRLFLNSVFDVMRYRVSAGRGSTGTEQEINRLIRASTQDAGALFVIRGLAGWTLPSAPIPEFKVEDADGSLLMLRALVERYHDMQAEDWSTATPRFLEQYGENLALITQAKTVPNTSSLTVTEEANRWVRDNPGVRNDYSLTYGLWAPGNNEPDAPFDFDGYLRGVNDRSLQVLGRELELKDLVGLMNDRVASQIRREEEEKLLADPRAVTENGNLTEEAERFLSMEVDPWLAESYWGYQQDGLPDSVSADDLWGQIGEPGQTETEVRRMVDDDRIAERIRWAVGEYVAVHDELMTELEENPERYEGSTTYRESQSTRAMRDFLRDEIEPWIRGELPEKYRRQWDAIYDRLFGRVMLAPWMETDADENELGEAA